MKKKIKQLPLEVQIEHHRLISRKISEYGFYHANPKSWHILYRNGSPRNDVLCHYSRQDSNGYCCYYFYSYSLGAMKDFVSMLKVCFDIHNDKWYVVPTIFGDQYNYAIEFYEDIF